MAVFMLIVILAVVVATAVEAIQKSLDRKKWIKGVEFIRDTDKDPWLHYMTARVVSDPEKNEFEVKFNPDDGHFYDRDNFGYHATEIYLKRNE